MARIEFTLEHPRGSGLTEGSTHSVPDTLIMQTDHGDVVATEVQVGWAIYTTRTLTAIVYSIATV